MSQIFEDCQHGERDVETVALFKDLKPRVVIVPVSSDWGDNIPNSDWSACSVVKMNPATRTTVLPVSWDDFEDEGVYDDLATL